MKTGSLFFIALIIIFSCTTKSFAQKKKEKALYVYAPEFSQYTPKEGCNIRYQHDNNGRTNLVFTSYGDTLIQVEYFNRDRVGNIVDKMSLQLKKDKKVLGRYNCEYCNNLTKKELKEMVGKTLSRLDGTENAEQ